ncbi:hypothetical protein [Spirosoma endophyticum]|uniref:Uncharacterized protein n=1 Tax=Spirosoma endophyticum TaxID=662367 RepID=A0A1I1ZL87_9BACT|nr:hypothetical protein [Spirosoma endophyticum]SFE32476.1 hypothetical protein SAMN05216167_112153 [Spirosoma endophyticum]
MSYHRTSWFFKFCESVLATTALLNLLFIPLQFLPFSFLEKYGQYFVHLLIGTVGAASLSSLFYVWIWHRQEQANATNSPLHHAWLQGIIRYWLALSISTYGFAKILKTQFQTPDFFLDTPLSSLDGMSLTWYYYGYSYPLAVIIGLLQIGGSILLLYRRTTLLGVMILLPVIVNIILINLFYKIAIGAFFNSVVYSLALVFFLFLNRRRLKIILLDLVDQLPDITSNRSWIKHSLRVLPIAIAFISLKILIDTHPDDQLLRGSWKVEKLVRNGQVQSSTAWLTDSKAWNRIYFAGLTGCAFTPNPYRFESWEGRLGSYEFDSSRNRLLVAFYTRDTLRAVVSNRTTDAMRLQGVLGRDTLDIQLSRIHR